MVTDHKKMLRAESVLPDDAAARNSYPMADGLLDYFPLALAEVARVSKVGNDQHNPGQPMHWAREKSTDHANKILRHMVDRGTVDGNGIRHSARLAWRALAMLQQELEDAGGKPGRASRWPDREPPKGVPAAGDAPVAAPDPIQPCSCSPLQCQPGWHSRPVRCRHDQQVK